MNTTIAPIFLLKQFLYWFLTKWISNNPDVNANSTITTYAQWLFFICENYSRNFMLMTHKCMQVNKILQRVDPLMNLTIKGYLNRKLQDCKMKISHSFHHIYDLINSDLQNLTHATSNQILKLKRFFKFIIELFYFQYISFNGLNMAY